ncbi:hypothetical protein CYANOKiyG1_78060 [Okeania sp. KiyG1]|nr:hypothetical protein CYANOKiyG1_02910 [Okeania sp. KiyG1]GGA57064.1 hypothetical protein CYANOKiyG1_78060 [Okeania sp. KiyG1]
MINWKDLILFPCDEEYWDLWHYYKFLWDNLPADTSGHDEWFKRVMADEKGKKVYDKSNFL